MGEADGGRESEPSAESSADSGPGSTGPAPTTGAGSSDDDGGDNSSSTGEGASSGGEAESEAVLMWLFDAESGAVQAEAEPHDGANPSSCAATADAFSVGADQPVHSGDFSLRVRFDREWLDDDPGCNSVRSFFTQGAAVQIEEGREYWHGWAVYVPDAAGDNWTTARWATEGQPNKALSIDLRSDLRWRFKSTQIGTGDFDLTLMPATADFGAGSSSVWHEFVANFVISTDEDEGFYSVWHRLQGDTEWTQVVDATGRTANYAASFPFQVRHGMHSGHDWGDGDADSRVLYFDEVRFGGAEVGFEGVSPGAATTPITG